MNEIIIRDLAFSYEDKVLLNHIDLELKVGSFTTVLGEGKTTFAHILAGFLTHKGYININRTVLGKSEIKNLRKIMGFVLGSETFYFSGETVLDDIIYIVENMGMKKSEIRERIDKIDTLFGLHKYFEVSPVTLTNSKKALVSLAAAVIHEPKVLILDDAFIMMDDTDKRKAFSILKRLNREYKMVILNMTSDIEESIYGKDILVFYEGNVLLHGAKENVYKEERKLSRIGIDLPFMVDLSHRLSYYDLIKEPIYDMKEMVHYLWK